MPSIYSILSLVRQSLPVWETKLMPCSIQKHRKYLQAERVPHVQRDDTYEYPYRSHGQPLLAYIAFAGCLFVLLVANGAALWKGFHLVPFLASYLTVRQTFPLKSLIRWVESLTIQVLVFLGLWAVLKIVRNANWSFVELSNEARVAEKLKKLHDICKAATRSWFDVGKMCIK